MNRKLERSKLFLIVFVILVLMASCNSDVVYQESFELPDTGWHKNNIAKFEFTIEDTASNYDIMFYTKNHNDYQFANIWFFVKTISPQRHIQTDTLECLLAEPGGKWYGKQSGNFYSMNSSYKSKTRLPEKGIYTLYLQQAMRNDLLLNIKEIGLYIEKKSD